MNALLKITICLLVMTAVFTGSKAQSGTDDWSWKTYKYNGKYPGWVVTVNGDTIHGYIQLRSQVDNQKEAWFFANESDKKPQMKYTADDAKAYLVADKYYVSVAGTNPIFPKKKQFVLVLSEGRIHFLKSYWYDDETKELKSDEMIRKGDDKPVSPGKFINFAKNMSEYISDYPELSAKVANKEKGYRLLEMYQIIDEYNKWWNENNR